MEKLYKQAQDLFIKLFDLHIRTKTLDHTYHEILKDAYEKFFDVMHKIWEKMEDIGIPINDETDIDTMKQEWYDYVEEMKQSIEGSISDAPSIWFKKLLEDFCDDLENLCGNMRSFVEKEESEKREGKTSNWTIGWKLSKLWKY